MVQYYVNRSKAEEVWETAPTIHAIQYDLKGHNVLVEFFDFGYPMWEKSFLLKEPT